MRNFSFLLVIVLAFGTAAVLYEKESRKVKGVLSQITDLQAKVGDMQAEINRLNSELEAVKLSDRRRPNLNAVANRVLKREAARPQNGASSNGSQASTTRKSAASLSASDVTSTGPAIRRNDESQDDSDWSKPTVDAEAYQESKQSETVTDPYQ